MKLGRRGHNLLAFTIALTASLLVCEFALRLLTPFPINKTSHRIPDAEFGYKLSSDLPDVDKQGFRNPPAAGDALAAIGDSHTFGNNVETQASWPAVLEARTGIPTYNFGVGGFGIYSYHALVHQSLDGGFQGAIVALYPANDFSERSHCPINRDTIFWKEEIQRLSLSMPACWNSTKIYKQLKIGKFIEEDTAIGSALKLLVIDKLRGFYKRRVKNGSYEDVPHTGESIKVSRVGDHARAMDVSRAKTRIVWSDFLKMLADWSKLAKGNNQLLGIMIVPSKPRVLVAYATRHGEADFPPVLDTVVKNEKALEARINEAAQAVGIPVVSALDPMLQAKERAMRQDVPLYRVGDGHPEEAGYAAYAKAAQTLILDACKTLQENPICVQATEQPTAAGP